MFNVQSSKDKKFKGLIVQCSKFNVQRIKIRSQCLNLFYIIVKEMVGKMVKNE